MRIKEITSKMGWESAIHAPAEGKCDDVFQLTTEDRQQIARAITRRPRRKKPVGPENLIATIEKVVAPLRKEIATLKKAIKDPVPPEPDEFEIWIQSKGAQKYAGEFIALSEPGVVVAHSPSNDDLLKAIANHPHRDDLVIDLVPSV